MNLKIFFYFILFFSASSFAQSNDQINFAVNGKTSVIPVYDREGTIYIAVKPFAEALSLEYRYNSETEKIELDFNGSKLFITSKNPFIIYYSKTRDKTEVFQLPTSTYLIDNQIFIPAKYSLNILKEFLNADLNLKKPNLLVLNNFNNKKNQPVERTKDETVSKSNFDITGISLEEKANGTLVRVQSKKRIPAYSSSFKNGILTIIFRKVNADIDKIEKSGNQGLIQKIEAKNLKSDSELKFYLRKEYTSSEVMNDPGSKDILIALHNKLFDINVNLSKEKAKWDFNVIVIDAGHGGKDAGTIGVDGIEEKNINLAIALKLGQDIGKNMEDVKVVFTRKTDRFIELYRRGQIANENGGKLFISIHCNATPHKPSSSNGFEVYLLRPGRTKEAISIAERENSVIKYEDNPARYKKLTDENFILVSMAQAAYMRYSEQFAELVDKEMAKEVSEQPRGVKQAGFYVLVGASMPSVLIETGFLSNLKDAHYLNSKAGQTKIAEGIFDAIKKFRELYEENMQSE
ncbi:MAG: N-acetylmuramoyl-L-alanine amidase family protein [Ignavibacteriaceae bacterium]